MNYKEELQKAKEQLNHLNEKLQMVSASIMAQDAQNLYHGPKRSEKYRWAYPIDAFCRGEWVEVVEKKALPEIAGYKGRDLGDMFRWGCSYIEKEFLERIHSYGITSLTLDVDGESVTVSKEQMNHIFEYLNLET